MSEENWLCVLQQEVDRSGNSQSKMAKKLGVSTSMLSQVLRGIYPGSIDALKVKVEGMFMDHNVTCPLKGIIPVNECQEHQKRPFSSSNRERVKLYRACRSGCPHSSLTATAKTQRIDVKIVSDDLYNIDNQLAYLRRIASGDMMKLSQLLEKELVRLATKYNQQLWEKNYSGKQK